MSIVIPPAFKHQKETRKRLKKSPRFFDMSQPGTGKTRVQVEDFAERRRKSGPPAIVTATRSTLDSAWGEDFRTFAPDMQLSIAYASNREKAFAADADVYITNHDGVNWLVKQDKKFWKRFEGGTIINDECFVEGTLVDTPNGPTPIEMLKCGDLVYTSDGILPITRTTISMSSNIIQMRLEDGTKIECTGTHPFASTEGWMEARRTRNLSLVRLDIHQLDQQRPDILRTQLQSQSNVGIKNTERTQSNKHKNSNQIKRSSKLEQRDTMPRRNQTKTQSNPQSIRSLPFTTRWQWTNSSMRKNVERNATNLLGISTLNQNWKITKQWLSVRIQTGFRIAIQKMGIRSRRPISHIAQTLGCQERFILGSIRVVNISRVQCPSSRVVYNLQVDGPHNYSVKGILNHNCTAFKHRDTARSANLFKIIQYFEYRRNLSGLPDPNGLCDLWHQVYLLDNGKRLGKSFFSFRSAVCTPTQVGPSSNMLKWEDKDGMENIVGALIKDISIKHLFEDCVDIPPNYAYTRPISLSPAHMKNYKEMEHRQLTEFNGSKITAINKGVLRVKLLQIASGAAYNNDDTEGERKYTTFATDRYEFVMDLAQEAEHSVVFFQWRHQREELIKECQRRKMRFAVYDGSTNDRERAAITKDFQLGLYDTILAHPKSAAHGLTWTRGTRTVWASPTDNAEWYEQGLKRIYRIGQTEKTETITVIARGTYDEIAWERLTGKRLRADAFAQQLRVLL